MPAQAPSPGQPFTLGGWLTLGPVDLSGWKLLSSTRTEKGYFGGRVYRRLRLGAPVLFDSPQG